MWVVGLVAGCTFCGKAKECLSKMPSLPLESSYCRICNSRRCVASLAANFAMGTCKSVACPRMIERAGFKPYCVESSTKMVFVARSAVSAQIGMEAGAPVNARPKWCVTREAFGGINTALADLVAAGAVAYAFEASMGKRQLAR